MAQFLSMARDYGRSIGFRGTFLIEPKPMEPMYHQYDSDAAAVVGFLRHYGLAGDFKVNVEANHATLAGKSFGHELKVCADAGLLGSIDANRGNPQNGWDTDQFAVDIYDAVDAMLVVLADGGFRTGGLNFDAKLRREATDLEDLFIGHIGGIDNFARALVIAHDLLTNSPLTGNRQQRYASFDAGPGKAFESGELTLANLRDHAAAVGEPAGASGKQEWIENLINDRISRN
jgi:xylose isomerase